MFSYNIYLMSLRLKRSFKLRFTMCVTRRGLMQALMFAFGVPVTLSLCYLFHLAFERRFMRNLSFPKKVKGEIFLASGNQ